MNDIQNGDHRHLEFTTFFDSGYMIYFQLQLTTFLQNFMNLFQSAVDLLCFVLKYKMVAVAMLIFIFVRFYGITTCRT